MIFEVEVIEPVTKKIFSFENQVITVNDVVDRISSYLEENRSELGIISVEGDDLVIESVNILESGFSVSTVDMLKKKVTDLEDLERLSTLMSENDDIDAEKAFKELDDTENLACAEWQEFDDAEKFFENNFDSPYKAASATHFGNVIWSESFIRFDGYENLETCDAVDYKSEETEIIERWLDANM